jgi:Fe-S cluster biogenesis protein NfuA
MNCERLPRSSPSPNEPLIIFGVALLFNRMHSNVAKRPHTDLLARADRALDEIRPHLNADGGDIEIVELTPDGHLIVRWLGNCQSCNMSEMTMRAGIEQTLRLHVPEIKKVVALNSFSA